MGKIKEEITKLRSDNHWIMISALGVTIAAVAGGSSLGMKPSGDLSPLAGGITGACMVVCCIAASIIWSRYLVNRAKMELLEHMSTGEDRSIDP